MSKISRWHNVDLLVCPDCADKLKIPVMKDVTTPTDTAADLLYNLIAEIAQEAIE